MLDFLQIKVPYTTTKSLTLNELRLQKRRKKEKISWLVSRVPRDITCQSFQHKYFKLSFNRLVFKRELKLLALLHLCMFLLLLFLLRDLVNFLDFQNYHLLALIV